jgi:hypothetical protein
LRTRSRELKLGSVLEGKGVEAWLKEVKRDDVVLDDVYVSPDFDVVNVHFHKRTSFQGRGTVWRGTSKEWSWLSLFECASKTHWCATRHV